MRCKHENAIVCSMSKRVDRNPFVRAKCPTCKMSWLGCTEYVSTRGIQRKAPKWVLAATARYTEDQSQ